MKQKCGNFLREISFGKYETKLYFGPKQDAYSTITGGIITILATLIFLTTSSFIIYQTLDWKNYNVITTYTDLNEIRETLKVGDFKNSLLNTRI